MIIYLQEENAKTVMPAASSSSSRSSGSASSSESAAYPPRYHHRNHSKSEDKKKKKENSNGKRPISKSSPVIPINYSTTTTTTTVSTSSTNVDEVSSSTSPTPQKKRQSWMKMMKMRKVTSGERSESHYELQQGNNNEQQSAMLPNLDTEPISKKQTQSDDEREVSEDIDDSSELTGDTGNSNSLENRADTLHLTASGNRGHDFILTDEQSESDGDRDYNSYAEPTVCALPVAFETPPKYSPLLDHSDLTIAPPPIGPSSSQSSNKRMQLTLETDMSVFGLEQVKSRYAAAKT